jgi:hypothetical protein
MIRTVLGFMKILLYPLRGRFDGLADLVPRIKATAARVYQLVAIVMGHRHLPTSIRSRLTLLAEYPIGKVAP